MSSTPPPLCRLQNCYFLSKLEITIKSIKYAPVMLDPPPALNGSDANSCSYGYIFGDQEKSQNIYQEMIHAMEKKKEQSEC